MLIIFLKKANNIINDVLKITLDILVSQNIGNLDRIDLKIVEKLFISWNIGKLTYQERSPLFGSELSELLVEQIRFLLDCRTLAVCRLKFR